MQQKTSIMDKLVSSFKKDGVDHIRIGLAAETQLGKMCAVEWRRRFFIPRVGEFLSPQCFANWLVTGDEAARHDPKYRVKNAVRGYQRYCLYAKFYQLCSMASQLRKEMKSLPFTSYKIHGSGIKEHDRWSEYPVKVKEMIEHILDPERGPKVPFPFDDGVVENVNELIRQIAAASASDDEPEEVQAEAETVSVEEEEVAAEEVVAETEEKPEEEVVAQA